jgi:hypothetical protein
VITVQQVDILALLIDFKCLRYTHIQSIIAAKHNSSDEQLSTMVRQLVFLGKLRRESGFVMLPGRKMDERVIKAFDVVMDLSDGYIGFICPGKAPFTLLFTVQKSNAPPGKIFGVVHVERFYERIINAQLSACDREMTVIFILRDKEQKELLTVDGNHYFAVQDENGRYKFLKRLRSRKNEEAHHAKKKS